MLEAYLYDGLRSPIGRHAGKLAPLRPDDLAAEVIREVVARNQLQPGDISDVVLGCVNQAGEDCRNVARFSALLAGLPPATPGVTVNRLCASCPNARFVKQFGNHSMPETGDNVARDFGITREQADAFALASQQKYATAEKEGFYKGEIHAVALPSKKKDSPREVVSLDEHPRRDSTLDSLAKLKPLFEGGVVTAGNASGVNDGAAALIIASKQWGEKHGKKPIVKILSAASAGVEPRIMGVGPAYAMPRALERAGLKLADMDIIEINEAFASQVLACLKLMQVDLQDPRVNPNGGAIAIGHPLGASGARLALTVARELQQSGARYAAVSLCIGVGQGLAVILERVQQ